MTHRPTWVNVYDYSRSYGGPEEGGWWFDVGHPILSVNMADQYDDLDTVHRRLINAFPSTGNASSVRGGEDYLVLIEEGPGQPFPKERPHYE